MEVYHVKDRSTPIAYSVALVILSSVAIAVSSLAARRPEAPNQSGSANQIAFWVCTAFAGVFLLGALGYLRHVCEIRMDDDGIITLVRVVGTTRIAARDIRLMEGEYVATYEGGQAWHMDIQYGWRRLRLDAFPGVIEFVAAVESLNPGVTIAGIWPFPPPDGPWPGRW